LVAALWKLRQRLTKEPDLEEEELVRICQDMEAKLIFAPTGCQDYWAAVRGGLNGIAFRFGGTEITTFRDEHAKFFDRHLIVCYSGSSRQSAINNWEIYRQIFDGDKNLLERFAEIGKLSVACWNSIQHFEFAQALELSHREWRLRCDLWPNIETPTTQKIAEVASASGAYFSRVCGAGGGGVMAIFADPENHSYIAHAVTGVGGKVLKANAQTLGLQVCENDNE
jgi:D-glycero-alpha-D-manno-heptose-7-phosphate kinase